MFGNNNNYPSVWPCPAKAVRDDDADVAKGDVVQRSVTAYDLVTVKRPEVEDGLTGGIAGVALDEIDNDGQRSNGVAVRGRVRAKVIGSPNAAAGCSLVPVNDADYLTYTPYPTGIQLVTTGLTDDTDVHSPTDSDQGAEVLLDGPLFGVMPRTWVQKYRIADIGTLETIYDSAPGFAVELVDAYCTMSAAVTGADSEILITDGTNTAATIAVPVSGSGAGVKNSGTLHATLANRQFTAGESIRIVNDGDSTGTSVGVVTLVFKEIFRF